LLGSGLDPNLAGLAGGISGGAVGGAVSNFLKYAAFKNALIGAAAGYLSSLATTMTGLLLTAYNDCPVKGYGCD
jgi:hypothetical protein